MKKLYEYLRKHFPDTAIKVRKLEFFGTYSELKNVKIIEYSCYIDNEVLSKFYWTGNFTTIKELTKYVKTKVKEFETKNKK